MGCEHFHSFSSPFPPLSFLQGDGDGAQWADLFHPSGKGFHSARRLWLRSREVVGRQPFVLQNCSSLEEIHLSPTVPPPLKSSSPRPQAWRPAAVPAGAGSNQVGALPLLNLLRPCLQLALAPACLQPHLRTFVPSYCLPRSTQSQLNLSLTHLSSLGF
jgi:hypothetical protein